MNRRRFIKNAGLLSGAAAGAAATMAAPAIAQSMPEIKWRLTSGFPKALDTIYGGAERFAKAVSDMTDGKFQIQVFASGEIVPTPGVVDAVQNATVEMAHTASYYYFGKDPTFAFGAAVPFGLNSRGLNAWFNYGGGNDALNAFYAKFKMIGFPAGNTGAQMGGWWRKEIKTVDDMKGVKFRVGGFGGTVLSKLGVVPQNIPGGDIYPALEKGTIDAAEWVGPYDDQKLGFDKVAKFYYYPGWWEGGATLHVFVNTDKWASLPANYQAVIKTAAGWENQDMQAQYDALNPKALRELVGKGVQLRSFSPEILSACYDAATQTYAEISAKNADFKTVYESMKAFRNEEYLWFQVADGTYDNFMYGQQRGGKLMQ
ncbi:MAG TPA: TRAP transporter substrate-binding protein [Candidatus Binatia bacterium]|nr:TRAP transporter substrate-binding protein [Candidatus Binatia bacterium]